MTSRALIFLSMLLPLAACSEPTEPAPTNEDVTAETGLSAEDVARAKELYQTNTCWTCHGQEQEGAVGGPALRGLAAHWTREDLASFIKDPSAWVKQDERVAELAGQYNVPMTAPFVPIAPNDRLRLADWLLTL